MKIVTNDLSGNRDNTEYKVFFLMQIVNCKEISEDTAAKKKKKKGRHIMGKTFGN